MEWLILGFVNLILAFVNLCIQIIQKRGKYGVITSLIILFCPIISVVILVSVWGLGKTVFKKGKKELQLDDLSFKKERVQLIVSADVEQEMQKIPVEEALIISDKFSKRETILNILKADYVDFLPTIRKAVDDWDSEIAHYAATTITQVIEKFKTQELHMRSMCGNEAKPETILAYIDYMEAFLEMKLLPEFEFKKYVDTLEEKMHWMKEMYYEYFDIVQCNRMIDLLMECEEYQTAEKWLDYLLQNYEDDLGTYKSGLKLYQRTERNEEFRTLMRRLKESSVILDSDALEWVRFYQV